MRLLNQAMHARLDRLADDHEDARVVGWLGADQTGGPIIEYRGTYRYVNRWGRVNATRQPRARQLLRTNL